MTVPSISDEQYAKDETINQLSVSFKPLSPPVNEETTVEHVIKEEKLVYNPIYKYRSKLLQVSKEEKPIEKITDLELNSFNLENKPLTLIVQAEEAGKKLAHDQNKEKVPRDILSRQYFTTEVKDNMILPPVLITKEEDEMVTLKTKAKKK